MFSAANLSSTFEPTVLHDFIGVDVRRDEEVAVVDVGQVPASQSRWYLPNFMERYSALAVRQRRMEILEELDISSENAVGNAYEHASEEVKKRIYVYFQTFDEMRELGNDPEGYERREKERFDQLQARLDTIARGIDAHNEKVELQMSRRMDQLRSLLPQEFFTQYTNHP